MTEAIRVVNFLNSSKPKTVECARCGKEVQPDKTCCEIQYRVEGKDLVIEVVR